MKVIITGASGLLGRQIFNTFSRSSKFEVIGTAFSRSTDSLRRVDLRDDDAIRDLIESEQPDVIIHAAAERSPDRSAKDPQATLKLNVAATQQLASLCAQRNIFLLYISTDYVFDGFCPPYSIEATPAPINLYGQTKLDGEKRVLKYSSTGAVLRVPILFGPLEYIEESAVSVLLKSVLSKVPVELDHWAVRYPTYTCDVASVCQQIVERRMADLSLHGIFHWSGDTAYTKYEIAMLIGEIVGRSCEHIKPVTAPNDKEPRPRDCHLDCTVLEELGVQAQSDFNQMLEKSLKPFLG